MTERPNGPTPESQAHAVGGVAGDLRFALRQILRRPGFAMIIVLTLAIGIGPNVAIFSVLKALVLNRLPYPEPERLVQVWETDIAARSTQPFSYPDFIDVKDQSSCFAAFGAYTPGSFNLGGGATPERIVGIRATAGVLATFGVAPLHGRLFTAGEVENQSRIVVLGGRLWQERYGADPGIVGTPITVNGEEHLVVGVMPSDFEQLTPWARGRSIQMWAPLVISEDRTGALGRDSHWLLAVGRLAEGVDERAAEAELRSIATRLQAAFPDSNARTQMWISPFLRQIVGGMTAQLLLLLGGVGLVLLIAVANVASLLLARGAGRQRELAIRASLGAGKLRIAIQALVESLLLALLGGAVGVLLGHWSIGLLRSTIPPDVPRAGGIVLDHGVLLFALALTLITGLACGVAPALTASRTNILGNLKEGSGTVTGGTSRKRLLRRLAAAQLALAFMLTNGAVLMFTSYRNVLETPRFFSTEEVLTVGVPLAGTAYEPDAVRVDFWGRLLERTKALPGVKGAAVTTQLPLEGGSNGWILVEGETFDPERRGALVEFKYVSPGYFEAMGIPRVMGRAMRWGEGSPTERVAVVNRELADRYWPGESPIGKRFRNNGEPAMWSAVVIGVVENVRQWGAEYPPLPEACFPFHVFPYRESRLVVRAAGDPLALVKSVREQVLALDSNQPIVEVRTMGNVLAAATRGRHFTLVLVSLFALVALLLSTAGIFGIMSHNVTQRRREMGVRVAFGAEWRDLVIIVLREAMRLVIFGIGSGALVFLLTSSVIASQLYGVGSLAVVYVLLGALIMVTVALAASVVPACSAARVDPNRVLRVE